MAGALTALVLVCSLYILVVRRVSRGISTFAVQSIALALYVLLRAWTESEPHLVVLALLTLVIKGAIVPVALMRALEKVQIKNEVEYVVNIPSSAALAAILGLVGFSLAERILPAPSPGEVGAALEHHRAAVSAAGAGASTLLVGMLVMIGRHKIVTKVVGLLLMENGVILAILGLTKGMPLLVECGVALDVLVAVQVLAIFTLRLRGGVEGQT